MKIAIFPGSFDPFTRGHQDIVNRGLSLFDKVIIAIGYNISKKGLLTLDNRKALIESCFENEPRVEVILYQGLTTDLCRSLDVKFLLRGVRSSVDFDYERELDIVNRMLYPELESVILMTAPSCAVISSSVVRELHHHNGVLDGFMPKGIKLSDYL